MVHFPRIARILQRSAPALARPSNGPPDAVLERNALEIRERENPVRRFAGHAVSLSTGEREDGGPGSHPRPAKP